MISTTFARGRVNIDNGLYLRGLSTDTKPLLSPPDDPSAVLSNESIFEEIDTGKTFMYDLQNNRWIQQ